MRRPFHKLCASTFLAREERDPSPLAPALFILPGWSLPTLPTQHGSHEAGKVTRPRAAGAVAVARIHDMESDGIVDDCVNCRWLIGHNSYEDEYAAFRKEISGDRTAPVHKLGPADGARSGRWSHGSRTEAHLPRWRRRMLGIGRNLESSERFQ